MLVMKTILTIIDCLYATLIYFVWRETKLKNDMLATLVLIFLNIFAIWN